MAPRPLKSAGTPSAPVVLKLASSTDNFDILQVLPKRPDGGGKDILTPCQVGFMVRKFGDGGAVQFLITRNGELAIAQAPVRTFYAALQVGDLRKRIIRTTVLGIGFIGRSLRQGEPLVMLGQRGRELV
jgi:hypothetical protein